MADPVAQFNIDGARQAGFSDDQIVQYLTTDPDRFAGGYNVAGALKAGAHPTDILTHLGAKQPEDSYAGSFARGAGDLVGGLGKTIETHLGKNVASDWLEQQGAALTPQDTAPAPIIDQSGVHAANVPSAFLQSIPGLSTALLAAKVMPGGPIPKALAAAATGFLASAGNEAQEAADKRAGKPNSPVTGADVLRGDLTSAAENAVGAAPMPMLLKGSTPSLIAGGGAISALKKLAVNEAAQGAAGAGGQVVHNVMQGEPLDPTQAANAAASSMAAAAPVAGRNFVREGLDAAKYSDINTPEMRQAATQFANRAQQIADGRSLEGGPIMPGAEQRTGAEVYAKATDAVHSELKDAVADLRKTTELPTDASNALDTAMSGKQHVTPREYDIIADAIKGSPQADNVLNLVRQARVADIVRDSGTISNGKFKGGLSRAVPAALDPHNLTKTGLVAAGGLALEEGAGHLMHYSPEIAAIMGGGHLLAKLADNITGAQTPMGRFVRNFADGTTPVRLSVPEQPAQPVVQAPQAPLAGPPRPWSSPLASAAYVRQAQANMAERAAFPALQQLARMNAVPPMSVQSPVARPAPPAPPPAIDPLNLPRAITTPAGNIIAGITAVRKMRAAYEGQQAAQQEINASPFLEQKVGGAENVPTPAASKEMRQAISSANALAKLRSDPEAEAAAKAEAKAAAAQMRQTTKVSKGNGQMTETQANGAGDEYKRPVAPYSNMPVEHAAAAILNDALKAGVNVKNKKSYETKTMSILNGVRDLVGTAAFKAPEIPITELRRFEGVRTQKSAREFRDVLKKEYPQAAKALDSVFSDGVIAKQWSYKG